MEGYMGASSEEQGGTLASPWEFDSFSNLLN